VTGNELEIAGVQEEFRCNGRNYCHQFCVCIPPTNADGIIWMDFLVDVNAKMNSEKQEMRTLKCKNFDNGPSNKTARGTGRMANCLALTVFSTSDGYESWQKLVRRRGDRGGA
jgi:hypothetical protein